MIKVLKRTNLWTKLVNWEFWPFGVLYFPVFFYWAWLCYKARSFFFFTASNPGIEYGGMLFESKIRILDKIPKDLKPITLFYKKDQLAEVTTENILDSGISYPLIIKPDIGERGWGVSKINNEDELKRHVEEVNYDIIIQEFIDYSIELGVFYMRDPNSKKGHVTSIVRKKMLSVKGDGISTVRDLMQKDYRARLYIEKFEIEDASILDHIPQKGERVTLENIGNHCRGTTFLNGNKLINQKLNETFDKISETIEGFYFGRYDLKCSSLEDLYSGKVKIMELNGAGSEPGHIYHPGASLKEAYLSIFYHQRRLLEISLINKQRGVDFMSFSEGLKSIFQLRSYRKSRKITVGV